MNQSFGSHSIITSHSLNIRNGKAFGNQLSPQIRLFKAQLMGSKGEASPILLGVQASRIQMYFWTMLKPELDHMNKSSSKWTVFLLLTCLQTPQRKYLLLAYKDSAVGFRFLLHLAFIFIQDCFSKMVEAELVNTCLVFFLGFQEV